MASETKVVRDLSGDRLNVKNGGRIAVQSGGSVRTPVITASTASAIPNHGHVVLDSTGAVKSYAVTAPVAGSQLSVFCTGASTGTLTVAVSTGGAVTLGESTTYRIGFTANNQSIILVGRTATKWDYFAKSSTSISLS